MDVGIIRMVVIALGVLAGLCVGGMVVCEMGDKPTPQSLSLLAASCVSALVGILAAPARNAGNPDKN